MYVLRRNIFRYASLIWGIWSIWGIVVARIGVVTKIGVIRVHNIGLQMFY